jgi:hypothetical protein
VRRVSRQKSCAPISKNTLSVDRIAIAIRQKGGFAPAAVGGPPRIFFDRK